MAVLRATLAALESIQTPGGMVELPFEWPGDAAGAGEPPEAPPIVKHIIRHPWQLPRLLRRDVP
jgi:hypothetical protein